MKKPSISNESGSRMARVSALGCRALKSKELVYQNTIVRLKDSNDAESRRSARSDSLGTPSVDFD
jgi:hypothetical protein